MESCNKIGAKIDLRFTRVADWFGSMEADMATIPGNAQFHNNKTRPQTDQKTRISRVSHYNDYESASEDKHSEASETNYEFYSSISEEKTLVDGARGKLRRKGQSSRPKTLIGGPRSVTQSTQVWWYIIPSNSLFRRVRSYRLYRWRRTTYECTSRETNEFKDFINRI